MPGAHRHQEGEALMEGGRGVAQGTEQGREEGSRFCRRRPPPGRCAADQGGRGRCDRDRREGGGGAGFAGANCRLAGEVLMKGDKGSKGWFMVTEKEQE